MRSSAILMNTVISWAVYGFLLTIALYLAQHIPAIGDGSFSANPSDIVQDISLSFLSNLLLILTGFAVYGFLRIGFSHLKWFSSDSGAIGRIAILYLLASASYLLTYAFAFKELPVTLAVDVPLMNAATMLVFAIIPYFRDNTFKG